MYDIKKEIEKEGPKLSRELIDLIVKNDNVSEVTARKRLMMIDAPICKIKRLFSDNQILFYHEKIYRKPEFYEALMEAFKSSGKKYFALINAIIYHYGFINKEKLATFSFSPKMDLKGHKRIDILIKELIDLGVIYENGNYYKVNSSINSKENFNHYKSLEVVENFIAEQFNDWSRSIGLTSYDSAKYYSEFGKFLWTFVSPSYVSTFVKYNKEKLVPGFVVADILIGNRNTMDNIAFFVNKVEILKNIKTMPTFVPFLITDVLELDALEFLKKKGVIIAFTDKIFGTGYTELIKSLINSITNAGAILKNNPSDYLKLIDSINKLVVGKTNNLKGDLFELAVGYYHGQNCRILDIGKIIYFQGKQREIDVLAVYDNKIIVAECKGYKSKIDKDEIEKWMSENIYEIRRWLLSIEVYANKELVFEHWSTGGYTNEAVEYISKLNVKKYKLEFIGPEKIIAKSKEIQSNKFKKILREYFMG